MTNHWVWVVNPPRKQNFTLPCDIVWWTIELMIITLYTQSFLIPDMCRHTSESISWSLDILSLNARTSKFNTISFNQNKMKCTWHVFTSLCVSLSLSLCIYTYKCMFIWKIYIKHSLIPMHNTIDLFLFDIEH